MIENVVIDVGAYIGGTVMDIYDKYPNSEIYAFEPCLTSFCQLKNYLGNKPRVTLLQEAVDIENSITKFHETTASVCASLALPCGSDKWKKGENDKNAFDILDSYDVKCTRLDSFLQREQIKSVEYLKIDAQGRDLNVLKSLGNRIVDVKNILAEARLTDFNMYEGDCHKDELVEFMDQKGFDIVSAEKQTYDQEENILFKQR